MCTRQTINRDDRIDILRSIGLMCIILAHVHPPVILMQLRSFDVPLMALLAGSSFATANICSQRKVSYISYLRGRLFRLLVPTWIFLAFFFSTTLLIFNILNKTYPFDATKIFATFLLMNGIGYVWIIRVFILVALIAPLSMYANESPRMLKLSYIIFFVAYGTYEAAFCWLPQFQVAIAKVVLEDFIYYLLPYGCIFFLGTRLRFGEKKSLLLSAIFLGLFVILAVMQYYNTGHFVPTSKYKYPPTAYYITYSLFASSLLYYIVDQYVFIPTPIRQFFVFLGRSSLWIYLWHIYIIYLLGWAYFKINYVTKFMFVLGLSSAIVVLQKIVLKRILGYVGNRDSQDIIGKVFSG